MSVCWIQFPGIGIVTLVVVLTKEAESGSGRPTMVISGFLPILQRVGSLGD